MPSNRAKAYWLLAALVLVWRLATALPLERAGYMDASYTMHVGANLAAGRGLVQDVAWNYLEGVTALPGPSNLYWPPLPSFLAGVAMALFGDSYRAAQLPFICLSVVPPLFAFYLARRLYARDDYAWTAALLAAFSGFYTIYWISPDNFSPFAVAAGFALVLLAVGVQQARARLLFAAGVCAGFAQLARADAVLLLAVLPLLFLVPGARPARDQREPWGSLPVWGTAAAARAFGAMGAGFLLVLGPWLARNWLVTGSLLAPGSARTLWLLDYDEFFSYDVGRLTVARYLDWGLANILRSKLEALAFVVLVLLFGVGQIFLVPAALVGFVRMRLRIELQVALIYLVLLALAMALVFTFPAKHGSMLHSAAALVPFGAVAVPPGLDALVGWLATRRRWNVAHARRFFRAGAVVLAAGFSLYLYAAAVWLPPGASAATPLWNSRDVEYEEMDRALDARGVPDDSPIITVDPPSFINTTARRSIYLPTESIQAIFEAARRFDAHYLVLQYDKPRTLRELYQGKAAIEGLTPIATTPDALGRPVTLFEVTGQ